MERNTSQRFPKQMAKYGMITLSFLNAVVNPLMIFLLKHNKMVCAKSGFAYDTLNVWTHYSYR